MGALNEVEIRDLSVSYQSRSGVWIPALRGVDLDVRSAEVVGVLGTSGSGKSTLALTIAGLLPRNSRIDGGAIFFPARGMRAGSGGVAMVYQEPATVLNPVRRVGSQVADVIQARFHYSRERCRDLALDQLDAVQLDHPKAIYNAYPHELSGGQRQRIVLAQAFARDPSLVVADEPTAALDTVTQAEVLKLMRVLVMERSLAMILITHDPIILYGFADRIATIDEGAIVEDARAESFWSGSAMETAYWISRC